MNRTFTAKCKCGNMIVFSKEAGNQLIYRCMDDKCFYVHDITEQEYKKLQQGQDFYF